VHAPRDPSRRGGTVAFDVPHAWEVAQYLLDHDILVDFRRGAGIRIAPHFYTADEELESAVAAIAGALESGEWSRNTARTSVVT
jgi:kynureninase